ncbi:helix-turn-helix domain-containing protein [Pleomorphovibrio marinus]|uniref:helix-turn-helix domain-containing protein n=1 Tax=Pleomorphovibrio marinus TaxID=2164132 RepID=UPI0018E52F65|nr:helix-turn-helix domain-containing protein [Pleomorphovibrio marinus]
MKSILFSLIAFLFAIPNLALSQYQLRGSLLSERGQPMPFVQTVLLDLSNFKEVEEVVTNETGEFHLEDVSEGEYLLMCHYMGFQTYFQRINLDSHLQLDEIVMAQGNWMPLQGTHEPPLFPPIWIIAITLILTFILWKPFHRFSKNEGRKWTLSFIDDSRQASSSPDIRNPTLLKRLNQLLEERLDQPDLTVDKLSELMNMSRRNLYRKLEEVTEQKPNAYIKDFRLRRAKEMIYSGEASSVSEIAYQTGFSSANYFSTCYKKAFGKKPKDDLIKSNIMEPSN